MEYLTLEPKTFSRTFRCDSMRDNNRAIVIATRWTERCLHRATREYTIARTKGHITTLTNINSFDILLRVTIDYAVVPGYPPGNQIICEYPVDNAKFPVPLTAAATLHSQDIVT